MTGKRLTRKDFLVQRQRELPLRFVEYGTTEDGPDDGGYRCSCGRWSSPKVGLYRPLKEFRQHIGKVIVQALTDADFSVVRLEKVEEVSVEIEYGGNEEGNWTQAEEVIGLPSETLYRIEE